MELPWSDEAQLGRLLRHARAGDREAFRKLYRLLYPRVWGYLARRMSVRADCEDLTARTFERLLQRLGQWDASRGNAVAFAVGIARSLLLDEMRKSAREAARPLEGLSELDQATLIDRATPHSLLEEAHELADARARIAALPADARELLSLRFSDGLSHKEIGALLGASEAAVKQRVSRLLRELRAGVSEAENGLDALPGKEIAR